MSPDTLVRSTPTPAPSVFVPETRPALPPTRRWRRLTLWLLLVVLSTAGVMYLLVVRPSGEEPGEDTVATAGSVADSGNGLPDLQFARPALTSATWIETSASLDASDDGVVRAMDQDVRLAADYTKGLVRLETTSADGSPATAVFTEDFTYTPGDTVGDPWARRARATVDGTVQMNAPNFLDVYQDLVTEDVRTSARNVMTRNEIVEGVSMTTYEFDLDWRALDGATQDAPPSFIEEDALLARMEVTIDDSGLVRRWSISLDEAVMRRYAEMVDYSVILSYGGEVTTVNVPVDIVLPTEYVDEP